MDFFGIGFWEIIFILLIALLIFGPSRLPEIARTLGGVMRKFKLAFDQVTLEMKEESAAVKKDITEVGDEVRQAGKTVAQDLEGIQDKVKQEASPSTENQSQEAPRGGEREKGA